MAELHFSTGVQEYVINDKVTIELNPTDITFMNDLFDAFDNLDSMNDGFSSRLEKAEDPKEVFGILKEANVAMRKVIDDAMGQPISDDLFGRANVYTSADGLPIWANFLFALLDEMDSAQSNEETRRNPRLEKYTAKYAKKGH